MAAPKKYPDESRERATRLAVEQAERALNSGGHISGKTTGLTSINDKIGGLHENDFVLAAKIDRL